MKASRIVIGLFLFSVIDMSCDDYLDTRIDTLITTKSLETRTSTLWEFATGFYAPLQTGFFILDNNIIEAITDDAQQSSPTGSSYFYTRGTINSDINPMGSLYNHYYEGIRAANFFLEYADENGESILRYNRDTIRGATSFQRDRDNLQWYKSEANIAKAYYYTELLKMFGGIPIVEKTIQTDDNPGTIPRSSYDDVVEYIVDLIDTHIDGLNDWRNTVDLTNEFGRFDPLTAMAIKSRALLYAASALNNPENNLDKWRKAAQAAHDVIQEMNYTMPENRNYGSSFIGNNPVRSRANIFIIRRPDDNMVERNNYPIATPGGGSGVTPTENLVSQYEYVGAHDPSDRYANRDPRLLATVVVNGSRWNGRTIDQSPGGSDDMSNENSSRTGYYLKKYLTDELNLIQGEVTQHQWIVYRYAEILLNYAEAMNEAYGPDQTPGDFTLSARQALMEVRRSASTNLPAIVTTDKDEFRDKIKHERRIELAFEGHRYWDLLRWKDASRVLNQPVKGVKVTRDKYSGDFQYTVQIVANRTFLDRNYRFPFQRREIVNSNGTLAQNEGY